MSGKEQCTLQSQADYGIQCISLRDIPDPRKTKHQEIRL